MDKEKFGTFIKNARVKKNITQKQLADELFIDVTAVSKWERGVTYPDITLVPEICKVLEVNEHELIQSSYDTEYRKKLEEALKYSKIKNAIFYTTSIMYLISIITCFIVNLAVNHTLSWFWIVLTSCLTAFTFIPTCTRFFRKYKFLAFLLSTLLSMFILFITCSIYTSGNWYFVAFAGTLLGYFAIFYPIIFNKLKMYTLEDKFNNIRKYFMLSYALGLLIITIFLLIIINTFFGINNIGGAILITLASYSLLLSYGIIELFSINRFVKIGIDTLLTGVELLGIGYVIMKVVGENNISYYKINFSDWANNTNSNVMCIIILSLVLISIIFFIIGLLKSKKVK